MGEECRKLFIGSTNARDPLGLDEAPDGPKVALAVVPFWALVPLEDSLLLFEAGMLLQRVGNGAS